MGRTKSPVLNTRAPPKPVEAAQASDAMETPSGSFSSVANSTTCPNCGTAFSDMSTTVCSPRDRVFRRIIHNSNLIQDFNNHVASCTRPSTAGSVSDESELSPPPESPSLDPTNTIAVQNPKVGRGSRSVIDFGDVVGNSLGQGQDQPFNQHVQEKGDATSAQVQQTNNDKNSSQIQGNKNPNQAVVSQDPVQEEDKDEFAMMTITPYIAGSFDLYEYEAVKEDEKKDEPEADQKDDENDLEDPKVSDELKVIDEQDNLDDPVTPANEVDTTQVNEEDLYSADTPHVEPATPLEPATPQVIEDDIYEADTPRPEPATEPATPQVAEEDIYNADTPHAETPTPLPAADEASVNGAGAVKASEALSNALLETAADVSTLEVPAESSISGADISQPSAIDGAVIPQLSQPSTIDGVDPPQPSATAGAGLPGPSKINVNSEKQPDSEVTSQITGDKEDKPEKVAIKFKKFTPVSAFEDFLKDPEKMSYGEVYHKAVVVADSLKAYQDEFDTINREIYDYEQRKAYLKEVADEKKKADEEKRKVDNKEALLAEDDALERLFVKYEEKLKLRGSRWLAFLTEYEQNGGELEDVERLKKLHEPVFTHALAKRKRTIQKEAAKPTKLELVNGDLPLLSKKDREPHFKRRKIIQDRVVFDEKKQSDVYVQPYNSKMTGNQKLLDRNAANFGEDELNENGRPKRSTAKRAFYDTEQSDTAPDTEPENLPAKRARTKRVLDDGISSPGRPQTLFETRDGTPVRTFASGKRVGRPPGAKTKNPGGKVAQSKLNNVQVAEEFEADEGEAQQNNEVESHAQELEPAQEQQLHDAASSLVAQTVVEANAAGGGPVKKKHAGGRPKKNIATEEHLTGPSNAPVEEVPIAPKPKNKGGRPRKHPAPLVKPRGGRAKKQPAAEQTTVQVGEEEEIIQSTEHDNESMFPSTASSRPTTSSSSSSTSSGGTDATFGGRQTRRSTRGKSQAQSASVNLEDQFDAPGPSVSTNGRGKRGKRTIPEDVQPAQLVESAAQSGDSDGENIIVDTYRPDLFEELPPPKKPIRKAVRAKKGKAVAQTALQPIAPQEVTPEQTGEVSNNTTGRPKRKRAAALPASSIDPDQLGEFLSDDDGETPPPPKRRNVRGGRKGKSVKREQTTDIDTGVSGDSSAASVPPSRKRAARAVTKRKSIKQELGEDESSGDSQVPQPPKTRKSRTNTLIIAEGAGPTVVPGGSMAEEIDGQFASAPKKRSTSGGKQPIKDVEIVGENATSKKRKLQAVSRGKGVALGDIIEPATIKNDGVKVQNGNENDGLGVGSHFDMGDAESAPPAKKRKTRTVKGKAAKTESTGDDMFSDSEDYTGMDPTEAELMRKKKRKSKKLAAATKARWANGTMKGPMEKRKATNAAKKAAKLAAKVGGLDGATDTAGLAEPVTAAAEMGEAAGPAAGEQAVQGGDIMSQVTGGTMEKTDPAPAPARISTRVRKPTSRAMGLDGADDYSDEEGGPIQSEYDQFQELSSPKGGLNLGKRARKSYVGLDDEDSF